MNKKIYIDIKVKGYEQAKAQLTEIVELLERLENSDVVLHNYVIDGKPYPVPEQLNLYWNDFTTNDEE